MTVSGKDAPLEAATPRVAVGRRELRVTVARRGEHLEGIPDLDLIGVAVGP